MNRTLPHDEGAEQTCVGAVLFSARLLAQVLPHVSPEDFYHPALRAVYEAILSCDAAAQPVDIIAVWAQLVVLGHDAKLKAHGSDSYLVGLVERFSASPEAFGGGSLTQHAQTIRDHAEARRLIERMAAVVQAGYQGLTLADLREQAQTAVFSTSQPTSPRRRLLDFASDTADRLEELGQQPPGSVTGIPTGFRGLDELTLGLQPGTLIIDAARPAMGKTAFALDVAGGAAAAGHPVIMFSIEMTGDQLAQRALSRVSGVGLQVVRAGLRGADVARVRSNLHRLDLPLDIVDWGAPTLARIRAEARTWRLWWRDEWRRRGEAERPGLVIVDYLSLIATASTRRDVNREREVAELTRGLKMLAKDLGCPVLALAQLNRLLESRPLHDRRPRPSDLRESGAVEQDADVILFLYRHHVYDPTANPAEAEVIIAKQRQGPTGTVRLHFHPATASFSDT